MYVALDGDVYDVSGGSGQRTYGPGGGYSIFAGRDAARAFVTGCFRTHLTYDLRGLSEKQLLVSGSLSRMGGVRREEGAGLMEPRGGVSQSLAGWKKFYEVSCLKFDLTSARPS